MSVWQSKNASMLPLPLVGWPRGKQNPFQQVHKPTSKMNYIWETEDSLIGELMRDASIP